MQFKVRFTWSEGLSKQSTFRIVEAESETQAMDNVAAEFNGNVSFEITSAEQVGAIRGGKREGAGRRPSPVEIGRFAGRMEQPLLDLMKSKGYTAREVMEWAIPLIEKKKD